MNAMGLTQEATVIQEDNSACVAASHDRHPCAKADMPATVIPTLELTMSTLYSTLI